jgi:hypothetical protein
MTSKEESRFWARVSIGGDDECWTWLGPCDRSGYGKFQTFRNSKQFHHVAHRVAYSLRCEGPQNPEVVMHTCDNPSCCNPAHLKAGTRKENMADMVRKRRQNKPGVPTGNKLTPTDASAVRLAAESLPIRAVARLFDLDPKTVRQILRREIWAAVL